MVNVAPIDLNLQLGDRKVTVEYRFDLDSVTGHHIHQHLAHGQLYEPELSLFLIRVLRPGDSFIDIGAHVGYFSILASKLVGDEGRVIGFEAEPGKFADLENHKTVNGCDNLTVFNTVLCAEPGERTFYLNSDNDGAHCLWDPGQHGANVESRAQPRPVTVAAESFDSATEALDLGPVKMMKIDTEGAEHDIVRGMCESVRKCGIPFILSEMNDFGLAMMGTSQAAYRDYMKEIGYDTFLLDAQGGFPKLLPNSIPIQGPLGDDVESLSGDAHAEARGVFNVLFSTLEHIAPYWSVETA